MLAAINQGDFLLNEKLLYDTEAESSEQRRQRSGAVSRSLRLLRAHGLIHYVPRRHRYHITEAGRVILVAVLTTASTTVNQLNQLGKAA